MKLLLQIVAVFGLVLLLAAGLTYFQSVHFLSRAKLTTGTVVGMFTATDPDTGSRSHCPQISYTTKAGKTVKFEANVCQSPAAYVVGDLVNIYYDPENPQDAQIKSYAAQYLMPTSLTISGLPLALIGLFGLFYQKKREKEKLVAGGV